TASYSMEMRVMRRMTESVKPSVRSDKAGIGIPPCVLRCAYYSMKTPWVQPHCAFFPREFRQNAAAILKFSAGHDKIQIRKNDRTEKNGYGTDN
ncbi:MAG: hypothetical protein IK080_09985, partial [Clostridia bacterium]|nr:hypothetical protein [Clostridia bacterium]